MTDEPVVQNNDPEEPEFYTEPPRLSTKDTVGVVLALIALTIIGYAGYLWLTPNSPDKLESASIVAADQTRRTAEGQNRSSADAAEDVEIDNKQTDPATGDTTASASGTAASGQSDAAATAVEDAAAQPPQLHDHDLSCAYCGMFSDKSLSHAVAYWADGSHTHHDSWDCLFSYGKDQGLTLERGQVAEHGGSLDSPHWLEAAAAFYLYGTQRVQGSMPPFVAAFASRAAADAAQPAMGGEVLDFGGLQAQWK